jgi:hypothetical protein
MIWLTVLIVILFGVIGYAGYRIWFLAGIVAEAQEYIEELEVTNRYMYSKICESYDVMKNIDHLGAFEKDDEAGTSFQLLTEVIHELKEQFDAETQEEK